MRRWHVYVTCFLCHFLLIGVVSLRDTLWLIAHDLTIFPRSAESFAGKAEQIATAALVQNQPAQNPVRQTLLTYLHAAGIERGYGYFAPNVPAAYKLVFELHRADGHVDYQLPRVYNAAAGLRLSGLLDEIASTPSDRLREYLVKTLTGPIWREYPDVESVRAVFGSMSFPRPAQYAQGQRESYKFLYAYDFSRVLDTNGPSENNERSR